jgi:peptidoglycan/xylan/chitin deacetylase (PgdA/CDA1 family)
MTPREKIAARILGLTGIAALARKALTQGGRFAVEMHGVASRSYPNLSSDLRPTLVRSDLERILAWLARRFRFLSPDEFLRTDSPGVLLTFDDGFANNHDVVLPLLEEWRAPAVFFVATGHTGGDGCWLPFVETTARSEWPEPGCVPASVARDLFDGMNRDQLRACAKSGLVTIGAHSVSHPRLPSLDDADLSREVSESKAALEEITGGAVDIFAYPFGDTDARVVRTAEEAGFRAAFVESPVEVDSPAMTIPRVGIHSSRSWYLASKLSGLHDRPLRGKVLSR